MIRLHQLLARQGISVIVTRSKEYSAKTTQNRAYSKGSGEECSKKAVSCLGAAADQRPTCPKTQEDVCQVGTLKVPPLPAECKSNPDQPGPVYDPTCMRPYVNPCKDSVKTCRNDMVPYPCTSPCERKRTVCLGEPDCAYERRIDWGLRIRQIVLALGAILGGLILYRMYGSEVKVQIDGSKLKRDKRFTRPMEVVKVPESSGDIPNKVDYLLIGGGAASYAAQQAIRNASKDSKVLIISDEPPFVPSMRPPLSKYLWTEKDRERALGLEFKGTDKKTHSVMFEPAKNYTPVKQLAESSGGVGVAQGYHIKKLEPQKKIAVLQDGKKISYEKCLLATGGKPKKSPPFDEAEPDVLKKVTFYRNSFDFQELEEMIQEGELQCIAIVGGGLLGTELAAALKERTKDQNINIVNVVKDVGNMTKILPTYLAKRISNILKDRGITVLTNSLVEDVAKDGSSIKLYVTNDHCVTASHVIVATGIDPNTDLANGACLELDPVNGGFLVNGEMQIANGLYAAGDCASFYDCDLGRRREEHHYNAIITGKIAGENMTGKSNHIVLQPTFEWGLAPEYKFEGTGKVDATRCCTVGVFPKAAEKVDEEEDDEDDVEDLRAHQGGMRVSRVANDNKKKKEKEPAQLTNNAAKGETNKKKVEQGSAKEIGNAGDGYDVVKDDTDIENTLANQSFDRGVIYYLNEQQVIIGVLLINLPGKITLAQGLIAAKKTYDDINEVTKTFDLHNAPPPMKMGKKKKGKSKSKRKTKDNELHKL